MGFGRAIFVLCLIFAAIFGPWGCLSDDVARAFGYTTPGIHVSKGLFGLEVSADSDVAGLVKLDVNTNGTLHAEATLNSDASAVTTAQGARITEQFLEARRIEWAGKEAQAKLVGENITAFFSGAVNLTNAIGKDAAVPIIRDIAAALRGSGLTVDVGDYGGTLNLGTAAATAATATTENP